MFTIIIWQLALLNLDRLLSLQIVSPFFLLLLLLPFAGLFWCVRKTKEKRGRRKAVRIDMNTNQYRQREWNRSCGRETRDKNSGGRGKAEQKGHGEEWKHQVSLEV